MHLVLPSRGILGQKSVDLRVPTFADIREVNQYSNDLIKRYKFVQLLSNVNLEKVTPSDMDYLFSVASFSLLLNRATFKLTCSCGNNLQDVVGIGDLDVDDLDPHYTYSYHIRLLGKKYQFRLPSASDIFEATSESLAAESDKQADQVYKDHVVAATLSLPLIKVASIPPSVYVAALEYPTLVAPHGFNYLRKVKCPKCGKEVPYKVSLTSQVTDFNTSAFMDRFLSLSSVISFTDFLKLSVVEYNAIVDNLNNKQ